MINNRIQVHGNIATMYPVYGSINDMLSEPREAQVFRVKIIRVHLKNPVLLKEFIVLKSADKVCATNDNALIQQIRKKMRRARKEEVLIMLCATCSAKLRDGHFCDYCVKKTGQLASWAVGTEVLEYILRGLRFSFKEEERYRRRLQR
ncbi:hypothetical protein CR956_00060 [Candidatus Saccharibacteria bacterium]|nr:MAG: hypothetical protein CR956_00060 [Candidatus Saccharibacteria bacterium]